MEEPPPPAQYLPLMIALNAQALASVQAPETLLQA
jgi:hypothetical protein